MIPCVNHIILLAERILPHYRSGNHKSDHSFIAVFRFLVTVQEAGRGYGGRAIDGERRGRMVRKEARH